MAQQGKRRWNVLFLLDQTPPTKMLLLQRSPTKSFAPNLFTGVGGQTEPGESSLDGAYRELREETGLEGILLTHFADCVIDNEDIISCYAGLLPQETVPLCTEGDLSWIDVDDIFNKDLIPTARTYLTAWKKKKFSVTTQWTIHLKEIDRRDGLRLTDVVNLVDGLYNDDYA